MLDSHPVSVILLLLRRFLASRLGRLLWCFRRRVRGFGGMASFGFCILISRVKVLTRSWLGEKFEMSGRLDIQGEDFKWVDCSCFGFARIGEERNLLGTDGLDV